MRRLLSSILVSLVFGSVCFGPVLKPFRGHIRSLTALHSPGLIGHWLMNEGTGTIVNDSSGNHNTGTFVDGTHFVPGKFGWALDFDGNLDAVDLGKPLIPATGDWSYVLWFRLDTLAVGHALLSQYLAGQVGRSLLCWWNPGDPPTGKIGIEINGGALDAKYADIVAGQWYQIAGMRTGSDISLFINGVLVDTASDGTAIYQGRNTFIGTDPSGFADSDAQIDHVIIYDRVLSAREISELYRNPFPRRGIPMILSVPAVGGPAGGIIIRSYF